MLAEYPMGKRMVPGPEARSGRRDLTGLMQPCGDPYAEHRAMDDAWLHSTWTEGKVKSTLMLGNQASHWASCTPQTRIWQSDPCTMRLESAAKLRAKRMQKYYNLCYTCPSFCSSFGRLQYFRQYARQSRIGACVANIVILQNLKVPKC